MVVDDAIDFGGRRAGISSVQSSGLLDRITGAWDNPAKPLAREGAMLAFAALVKQLGEAGEPYLLPLMPKLLERYADKVLQISTDLPCQISSKLLGKRLEHRRRQLAGGARLTTRR